MKVYVGDLYSALPKDARQFDLIVANPPLLPFPRTQFYPFVGHGGPDGMEVTWKIISGLRDWLAPLGIAKVIGTCISDGLLPVELDTMKSYCSQYDLDIIITIIGHAPFNPGSYNFEGLVETAVAAGSTDNAEVIRTELEEIIVSKGGSHLCYFSLTAKHGRGKLSFMDLSNEKWEELWFI